MFFNRHPESNHLMFVYCYPCGVAGDHKADCNHSWEERGWVGTFTTVKLAAAVAEYYVVSDVKEVSQPRSFQLADSIFIDLAFRSDFDDFIRRFHSHVFTVETFEHANEIGKGTSRPVA
jgi:hypothetical protein